ncbi:MAG: phosphate acyltransferase PlsX, partial [Planctomycetota bacterium]|nr:phosphate acyltransferase PlsX [Planctomycetota bacterium]
MTTARIALDVMGGDHAPRAVLEGALMALDSFEPLTPERLLLVGPEELIREQWSALGGSPEVGFLDAPETIGMGEKPAVALRAKPNASIPVAMGAVKAGAAGAVVSMGNTGAMVGAATMILRTLPGVRRPGIAVTIGFTPSPITVVDMGANTAPRATDLVEYAVMASAFQAAVLGMPEPRVGLLNIGEEDEKGTALTKEARALLAEAPISFIGNVEPSELFQGKTDVLVTDGFTGNVVLKLVEGFSEFLIPRVMGAAAEHGTPVAPEAIGGLVQSMSYSAYGGALLLGVNGVVIIGHGRSDATAVSNAVRVAAQTLDGGVNERVVAA